MMHMDLILYDYEEICKVVKAGRKKKKKEKSFPSQLFALVPYLTTWLHTVVMYLRPGPPHVLRGLHTYMLHG